MPKTEVDRPEFSIRCDVLADGAFLASYVREGADPTLVLVPETHGDRSQFFEPSFLDPLPKNRRIVIVESRGQGRSWPPPAPGTATIERYADDVLTVVARLRPTSWFIGGHSLGGMIALEIAGRRPSGLRGAIALEGWAHHGVQAEAFPVRQPRTPEQAAEARRQRQERYRTQRWTPEEAAALGQAWIRWENGERILRETDLPILSVWGDRGGPRPDRAALRLPDKPTIELRWIAGSDHYITDPPYAADVASAIAEFIVRHSKS